MEAVFALLAWPKFMHWPQQKDSRIPEITTEDMLMVEQWRVMVGKEILTQAGREACPLWQRMD